MDVEWEGKKYKFPGKYSRDGGRKCSDLHKSVRSLLRLLYPSLIIMEEVSLPGINLTADFYLPMEKMVVEAHGEQHYKFIPFFHGTKLKFLQARRNDSVKQDWCEGNEIKFVELPFDEGDEEWTVRVKS